MLALLPPQDVSQVLQTWLKISSASSVEEAVVDVLARAVLRGDPYRALVVAIRQQPRLLARIEARMGEKLRADIAGATPRPGPIAAGKRGGRRRRRNPGRR